LLAFILIILLGSTWGAAASAQEAKLVVFAAASLKDALDAVNAAYRREKS
jgi:ABC-type molybdate transport system substrate-binding protein